MNIQFFIRLFLLTQSDFLSQTKIRTYRMIFFIRVPFGVHSLIFFIRVIVLRSKQARSHCWMTSLRFLIRHELAPVIHFFIANNYLNKRYDFWSDQTLAQRIWFSVQFFVYEKKNRVLWAGHNTLIFCVGYRYDYCDMVNRKRWPCYNTHTSVCPIIICHRHHRKFSFSAYHH